ncbi:hypothetical protein AURDEDRAFT_131378 [Auricularia subglabra TFB-10046 SS5]|uniref:Uncharacterized protein n=1 Tax=Auricularia subglabra (strain TFB-10046 / SS5) TaxID=717982 RepID=J0D5J0_AURST|nr:hypothetical protein AURDEDRAFT_131378 [Auricularia subglabra TFB-10046 SS5]
MNGLYTYNREPSPRETAAEKLRARVRLVGDPVVIKLKDINDKVDWVRGGFVEFNAISLCGLPDEIYRNATVYRIEVLACSIMNMNAAPKWRVLNPATMDLDGDDQPPVLSGDCQHRCLKWVAPARVCNSHRPGEPLQGGSCGADERPPVNGAACHCGVALMESWLARGSTPPRAGFSVRVDPSLKRPLFANLRSRLLPSHVDHPPLSEQAIAEYLISDQRAHRLDLARTFHIATPPAHTHVRSAIHPHPRPDSNKMNANQPAQHHGPPAYQQNPPTLGQADADERARCRRIGRQVSIEFTNIHDYTVFLRGGFIDHGFVTMASLPLGVRLLAQTLRVEVFAGHNLNAGAQWKWTPLNGPHGGVPLWVGDAPVIRVRMAAA